MKQNKKTKNEIGILPKTDLSNVTTKMATPFPDPNYCPDVPSSDGKRCMDFRMDIETGEYVYDPGWWKNINKMDKVNMAKGPKPQTKEKKKKPEKQYLCDSCTKFRVIDLPESYVRGLTTLTTKMTKKKKSDPTIPTMLCGILILNSKVNECKEYINNQKDQGKGRREDER